MQVLLLILSLAILYYGAEFVLDGAEKIGKILGLSNLVIGLLIVGFGTSLPEFFVSQLACFRGHSEIALGNIVGSNVANLFLIMGIAGILAPLRCGNRNIKIQFLFHLAMTVIMTIVLMQKELYPLSAIVLVIFFVNYLYYTFTKMKEKISDDDNQNEKKESIKLIMVVKLLSGFVLLYAGGELLVSSGSSLGRQFGVSEYVISAIFVAFGTSFPELVTALVACYKKKDTGLIVGNVIGSNIFNVAFVLASLGFYNVQIKDSFSTELFVLLGTALFLIALAKFRPVFHRFAGTIFLVAYFGMIWHWTSI